MLGVVDEGVLGAAEIVDEDVEDEPGLDILSCGPAKMFPYCK